MSRISIFNKQDQSLAEAQGSITVAMSAIANIIDEMPSDLQPLILAVVAQLGVTGEALGELRGASQDLAQAVNSIENRQASKRFEFDAGLHQINPDLGDATVSQLCERIVELGAVDIAIRQLVTHGSYKIMAA